MAEYIGSRISLISKRDIRYVGTLHEISSENSTVALENVKSFGTEDRHLSGSDTFVPAGDHVYEYIVFRGSDVKDLRIEKEPEKPKEQVPDDPAILGNARPTPNAQEQRAPPGPQSQPNHLLSQQFDQTGPPRFPQQVPTHYGYPPNQRYSHNGPPHAFAPYGYPGMQYGGPPPGWQYPAGQGFARGPTGQFNGGSSLPHEMQGPPGQVAPLKPQTPAEAMGSQAPPEQLSAENNEKATVKLPDSSTNMSLGQTAPPPPTGSKPPVADALAPPAPPAPGNGKDAAIAKAIPTGPKSGRIMPAIPMMSPAQKSKQPVNGNTGAANSYAGKAAAAASGNRPAQIPSKSVEDANRDARAAVAAAMAKLPPAQGQSKKPTNGESSSIDNLTNKVNEMRTNDNTRNSRQPVTGGHAAGNRGGRGTYRGGRPRTTSQTKTVEVPNTDYDFATANAKFNKEDVKKAATVGGSESASPTIGPNGDSTLDGSRRASETVVIPAGPGYNKASSFFDDISSESKDRQESSNQKMGGREFWNEERSKNVDTFGQGSVDNGYRGGFRGRGRGRGFRSGGRGRGAPRGRGGAVAAEG